METHKWEYERIPGNEEDLMKDEYNVNESNGSAARQVFMALVINFSSLAPSLVLGFSAVVIPTLNDKENAHRMSDDEVSWVASVPSITTPIGCLLAGSISDKWGRRIALHFSNLVCLIGWITILIAYYIPTIQYQLLITGRLITGLTTGLAMSTPTVYSAEIASPKLRSTFTTWNGIAFSIGILLSYVFGLIFESDWGMMSIVAAILPVISSVLISLYLPESPTWLSIQKNTTDEKARISKSFRYNLADATTKEEIYSFKKETTVKKISKSSVFLLKRLTKRTVVRPMILILVYFFFLQFSGAFVIICYAIDFVQVLKITFNPYYIICAIATTRLAASITLGVISRKFGRRPLSIYSSLAMTLIMMSLALYLMIITKQNIQKDNLSAISWIPTILLTIYFYICSVGFLTVPFAMSAEIFPSDVRGVTNGLATCLGCIFDFVVLKMYPGLLSLCGGYTLLFIYGNISLLGTIFVFLFLPETKDKTFEEIERYFEGKSYVFKN